MSLAQRTSSAPGAELARIGNAYCIFRGETRALALVNESAAHVFASLARNNGITADWLAPVDPVDTDEQAAHAIAAQLAAHGFLDVAPRSSRARAEPHRPVERGHSRTYRIADGPLVRLVVEADELAPLLAAALRPLSTEAAEPATSEIVVARVEAALGLWRDGTTITTGLDLPTARRAALQSLLMALLPPERVSAVLHASSVCVADRAVILAGSTGSGKTTLMMALIAAGARYVADDFTPLDRTGTLISPFPLAASVKRGSWDVLRDGFPTLERSDAHVVGTRQVRYVEPAPGQTCLAPCKVGAIVLPRHVAQSRTEIERVPPEEALALLMETGSEIVGDPASIGPLVTLLNTTPAWRIAYPDTSAGVAAVLGAACAR